MHLKYYKDQEAVNNDLLSGDLDMALGIGPLTAKQIQNLKFYHSDVVDVQHSDVLQHALMIMNTNATHTDDITTRRAIIHGIDKSRFIEKDFLGLEQPVSQLLPYSAPFCNVDLNPKRSYDVEKAELLLYDKIKKISKIFIHYIFLRYFCNSVFCEEELNNPLFNSSACAKDLRGSLTVLLYTIVLVPKVYCTSVPFAGQLL